MPIAVGRGVVTDMIVFDYGDSMLDAWTWRRRGRIAFCSRAISNIKSGGCELVFSFGDVMPRASGHLQPTSFSTMSLSASKAACMAPY